MTSQIDVRVGPYDIVRPLGRGGMATVSLAFHRNLRRRVALKQLDLHTKAPDAAARFIRESRIAASLQHPHIVTVHDFFEHEGVPYIAMEFVPGGSLRRRIADIDTAQALAVTADMLDALTYTEARRIVHRDIKPDNMLVTAHGRVKLADFGIAKAIDEVSDRLTAADVAVGTQEYMSPEQATASPVGPSADLYALGMVLFHLLTGRPPFQDDSPMGLMFRQVHEVPPRIEEHDPSLDRELGDLVEWLVQKEPWERPQSAREAWAALSPVADRLLGQGWRDRTQFEPTEEEPHEPAASPAVALPTPPPRPPAAVADTDAAPTVLPARAPAAPPLPAPPPPRLKRRALAGAAIATALVLLLVAAVADVLPLRLAAGGALLCAGCAGVARLAAGRAPIADDGPIRPEDWLS